MHKPLPGDIVLWQVHNKSPFLSRLFSWFFITFGQGGERGQASYSHSGIYAGHWDGHYWVYESTWPKTRLAKIPDKEFNQFVITVWRHIDSINTSREAILIWCKTHIGEWYDLIEVISLGLINPPFLRACSEFVREAHIFANLRLGRAGEFLISPNEIRYETKKLQYMGRLNING